MPPRHVVVFSSQDWFEPLRTNRHRIAAELASLGSQVLFVETEPWLVGAGREVSTRGFWLRLLRSEPAGPVRRKLAMTIAPRSWRSERAGRINGWLTTPLLQRELDRLGFEEPLVIVYDPRAILPARSVRGATVIYDCVDAHEASFPPAYRGAVVRYDSLAASLADGVTVTTESLLHRHRVNNPNTVYVPNVADFDHFSRAVATPRQRSVPTVGFVGNLLALKFDFELLERVAIARSDWRFRIVGPVRADARVAAEQLGKLPNVEIVGLVAYEEIPTVLSEFDVAIIPYRTNEYTASCFPLKTYEYLAAGLPVVATGLPSLPDHEPEVLVAHGDSEFVRGIERQLERVHDEAATARRQALASGQTWRARTEAILRVAYREAPSQ